MKLMNYTPHDISIYGENSIENGPQIVIPPSGGVARVAQIELGRQRVGGFNTPPVVYELVEYGHIQNLPPKVEGTLYIVSLVCALAARGRDDLLAPYIEVRNESGTMIGCRYLQKAC